MDPQPKPKTSAKDFFLNLGAIVALFTIVANLINLLFTVINNAYPQIQAYNYYSTPSISFPVATLIVFFPIYIWLMWFLEKEYQVEPERKHVGVRKWLTYITLFIAGLALAGDLVTVLYYYLDGQELTAGFLLKVLVVLIVALGVFMYYISDIREKLTSTSRKTWFVVALILIIASIAWGFAVLGSPRTQQLIKYDEQKVADLQNITYRVEEYYQMHNSLPSSLLDLAAMDSYQTIPLDPQTNHPFEYIDENDKSYEICATFNKETPHNTKNYIDMPVNTLWNHPAGHYCFTEAIPGVQPKVVPSENI